MSARRLLLAATTALLVAALEVAPAAASAPASEPAGRVIAPLLAGDEPIVVTEHTIKTAHGPLQYEARAGRLPIRVDQTGEVHGYIFFVAYVVKNRGVNRPLTIAWNGGPTVPSIYLHTEALGPRLVTKDGFVDNPDTPLETTDLVFYDAIETGFSRPSKPEFAQEFFSNRGDFAATAEFVRAYRERFDAETQPLFLLGESYGGFRAAAVGNFLVKRGVNLSGLIIVSGGFAGVNPPFNFQDAMQVPQRTATAFYYKRLPPELMRDREATLKQATDWATNVYWPALNDAASLTDSQRTAIVDQLATYTGVRPDQIDHKTMILHVKDYLAGFFDTDPKRVLSYLDARKRVTGEPVDQMRPLYISRYLRGELGYRTDLGYANPIGRTGDVNPGYLALEEGYMPTPGPEYKGSGAQWAQDNTPKGEEAWANVEATMEVKYVDTLNGHWLEDSLDKLPHMRIFVPMGRFDVSNMCAGQAQMSRFLKPDQASRVISKCYEGGHMLYQDAPARTQFLHDIANFIADTVADRHTPNH
jgi:carboxypeptidase C (cathepsin A)